MFLPILEKFALFVALSRVINILEKDDFTLCHSCLIMGTNRKILLDYTLCINDLCG